MFEVGVELLERMPESGEYVILVDRTLMGTYDVLKCIASVESVYNTKCKLSGNFEVAVSVRPLGDNYSLSTSSINLVLIPEKSLFWIVKRLRNMDYEGIKRFLMALIPEELKPQERKPRPQKTTKVCESLQKPPESQKPPERLHILSAEGSEVCRFIFIGRTKTVKGRVICIDSRRTIRQNEDEEPLPEEHLKWLEKEVLRRISFGDPLAE